MRSKGLVVTMLLVVGSVMTFYATVMLLPLDGRLIPYRPQDVLKDTIPQTIESQWYYIDQLSDDETVNRLDPLNPVRAGYSHIGLIEPYPGPLTDLDGSDVQVDMVLNFASHLQEQYDNQLSAARHYNQLRYLQFGGLLLVAIGAVGLAHRQRTSAKVDSQRVLRL
jgi:hypothetical protein